MIFSIDVIKSHPSPEVFLPAARGFPFTFESQDCDGTTWQYLSCFLWIFIWSFSPSPYQGHPSSIWKALRANHPCLDEFTVSFGSKNWNFLVYMQLSMPYLLYSISVVKQSISRSTSGKRYMFLTVVFTKNDIWCESLYRARSTRGEAVVYTHLNIRSKSVSSIPWRYCALIQNIFMRAEGPVKWTLHTSTTPRLYQAFWVRNIASERVTHTIFVAPKRCNDPDSMHSTTIWNLKKSCRDINTHYLLFQKAVGVII